MAKLRWQNSRWLPSWSEVLLSESQKENKVSESNMAECKMAGHHQVESEWMSEVVFVQMVGTNLGKCEWVWEGKLRWLKANWQNSRWLPSSSWVRINEFESDWISLSQSQSGERVFLSESQKKNKVSESKMAEFKMAGIIKLSQNETKTTSLIHSDSTWWCQPSYNPTWQNSSWLPSSSGVRMNDWSYFVQMVGTNLGKCQWVWEEN